MKNLKEKLDQLRVRHSEITQELASPDLTPEEMAQKGRDYSELDKVVSLANDWQAVVDELSSLDEMLQDKGTDAEMRELAELERDEAREKQAKLERDLQLALLPKDEADDRNAILEVRAGTGGDEAALFAADLFGMYQRYAHHKGWKFEIIEAHETGIGGYKEASATISVPSSAEHGAYGRLKYESGVHRVQRVPKTETSGRIHTSAATVAILPEAQDVDVEVNDADLEIDTFRASGAGGQHVNTTDSAVRITHKPTGVVVECQSERSQLKNRAQAMKILRARIYEAERERLARERSDDRKSQVGSGDRSERIRTYNFPQGRVSDHRINLTLHKIDEILGGSGLDEVIDTLITEDQMAQLAAL